MNKFIFGLAGLSLVFSVVANAQTLQTATAAKPMDGGKSAQVKFGSIDSNKDGRVSRGEAKTHASLTSAFDTLDTDGNSYLSAAEYGKWKTSVPAAKEPRNDRMPSTRTSTNSVPVAPTTR